MCVDECLEEREKGQGGRGREKCIVNPIFRKILFSHNVFGSSMFSSSSHEHLSHQRRLPLAALVPQGIPWGSS